MSCPENAPTSTALRATFTQSGLVLSTWAPYLVQRGGAYGGTMGRHFASSAVLDLTITRATNDEGLWVTSDLFVTEVVAPVDDVPREALLAWAEALDYRRVWWGGELITLDRGCGLGGAWRSRCSTCGSDWADDTYSFWINARGAGFFPLDCALCGHALPQSSLQTIGPEAA